MRPLYHAVLWMLALSLMGCELTGYQICLSADSAETQYIHDIESILKRERFRFLAYDSSGRGSMVEWRERDAQPPSHPGEVYTAMMKRMSDEKYSWVEAYIYYVKTSGDRVTHVRIGIVNRYVGLTVPEVKAEIERVGQRVYQEFSRRAGVGRVTIEKRELKSPVGGLAW